jgi:iron complex outermembrane recepter protein
MTAVFGEFDWALTDQLHLLAGLRAEHHNYGYTTNLAPGVRGRFRVAPSRTDEFDLLTPKLGLIWRGSGNGPQVYVNYARGERAPQASDQYRLQRSQTEATLNVETLDSLEIGVLGALGPLDYDIAAYTQQKDNFFFRDSDGFNVPDGKTDHAGVEVQLSANYANGLFWRAAAAWADQTYAFNRNVVTASEDIVAGTQIDTAPEWLGDATVGWRGDRLEFSLSAEHVGDYFTDAANLHTYPGHTIANLRGSWAFSDALEAFVIVRNVGDVRYADRADFANGADRYFPGEPVNATFGVRVKR